MMPHPLGLSDAQMQLIRQSAKSIPIEWRHRFLEACADRLLAVDVLTNDDVQAAVRTVLTVMFGKTGSVA